MIELITPEDKTRLLKAVQANNDNFSELARKLNVSWYVLDKAFHGLSMQSSKLSLLRLKLTEHGY